MKLATSSQMRSIDAAAIDNFGIPGVVLMENAACSVFEACSRLDAYKSKKAVIFCGSGNNGGDGFALARHMQNDGAEVKVVLVCEPEKLKGDAKTNYEICVKMQMPILRFAEESAGIIGKAASESPLVVDAMLGTGVSGDLRSPIKEAVSIINESGAFVVAVDCPTGGNPDNGKVSSVCVRAELTVTLALMKPGLLLYPLADFAGEVLVGQIGAPETLLEGAATGLSSLDARSAACLLPKRKERSHKGTYGKVILVAGGEGMAGSAAFCARAAYKAGCGYVDICSPCGVIQAVHQLAPQAVTTSLPEKDGFVYKGSVKKALEKINSGDICLIGPGLGGTDEAAKFVKQIIRRAEKPLIIDADGLNAISDSPSVLKEAAFPPVITPHPLEMSRISGKPVKDILDNMLETAIEFSEKFNCVTVLKDASTIISDSRETFINKGGCSALAKAGSGDILAGLMAGIIAQGLDGLKAGALAAYIHSKAGAVAAAKYSEYSVSSKKLLNCVHEVFLELAEM